MNEKLLKDTFQEVKELNATMKSISIALGEISVSLSHIAGAFQDKKLYMCGEVTTYQN